MINLPLTIHFGAAGDYKLWAKDGWHHDSNDQNHTWTDQVAELKIQLRQTRRPISLELDMIPVTADGVVQEVYVFINGLFASFTTLAEPATRSARIDAQLLRPGENIIKIVCPKAACPADYGNSDDQRILGVAVRSLTLANATD